MADDEPVPMPDVVYHYTSIDTMMKIVQSQSIWATSVRYLNDTSEQTHFLNLVRQRIASLEFKTTGDKAAANLFKSDSDLDDELFFQTFVASFSRDGDSLSQWRSYCNAGNGVAIGFSTNCLKRAEIGRSASGRPITRFKRVSYPTPDAIQEIDAAFFEALSMAKTFALKGVSYVPEMAEEKTFNYTVSTGLRIFLKQEACLRKSHDFRSEKEYRLIVDLTDYMYEALKYRTSRSCLIPYVEVLIPRLEEGHDSKPSDDELFNDSTGAFQFIKRVTVGPSPNISLTFEAIRAFFKTNKMKIDIVPSAVAFRDW